MFHKYAKEENLLAQSNRENSSSAQKQNNLSFVFPSAESSGRAFEKKTSVQRQRLLEAASNGWNLGIFILGFGATQTLEWWQYFGGESVNRLSRKRRCFPKIHNADSAEKHQCQNEDLHLRHGMKWQCFPTNHKIHVFKLTISWLK